MKVTVEESYIYNRTKIGGPELIKIQVFPMRFDDGLFQGNFASCEFYRFMWHEYIFWLDDVIPNFYSTQLL